MLLIQELPYLYFLVIFLFFLVRLFYNATSTDAGKTRQGSKYSIQLVIISSIRGTIFPSENFPIIDEDGYRSVHIYQLIIQIDLPFTTTCRMVTLGKLQIYTIDRITFYSLIGYFPDG